MLIRVLLFARLREIVAAPERQVEVPGDACVADAWDAMLREHGALAAERSSTRAAVNGRIVAFDVPLREGDELAFLPPVGGG